MKWGEKEKMAICWGLKIVRIHLPQVESALLHVLPLFHCNESSGRCAPSGSDMHGRCLPECSPGGTLVTCSPSQRHITRLGIARAAHVWGNCSLPVNSEAYKQNQRLFNMQMSKSKNLFIKIWNSIIHSLYWNAMCLLLLLLLYFLKWICQKKKGIYVSRMMVILKERDKKPGK